MRVVDRRWTAMKFCSVKCSLLCFCVVQLLATLERLIFDFLAYLWLPILFNFAELIALIFAFFGAYQLRFKYLVVYCVWSVVWICWNLFLVCLYLGVDALKQSQELLSLHTGAVSFWETGGLGCVPVYLSGTSAAGTNASVPAVPRDPYQQRRPQRVNGCWLPFEHVELIHCCVQLLLTGVTLALALCQLVRAHRRQDDSFKSKSRPLSPAFHIEYRPHRTDSPLEGAVGAIGGATGPAPMTPRKIKRRSMTRSSQRSSGRSSRSGRQRASQRQQRRHVNPVTQLMDSSSSDMPPEPRGAASSLSPAGGLVNPSYQSSEWAPPRPPSVHSSYSNYHGQRRPLPTAVASDYGTTGTLSPGGVSSRPSAADRQHQQYGQHQHHQQHRRPAAQVPGSYRSGYAASGSEYSSRYGPPPYSSTPSLNETAM